MRDRLSRIRSPWRRCLLHIYLTSLIFATKYTSARARIHWIGGHGRPRRPERALGFFLIFGGMLALETQQYLLWSITLGGGLAIFLNLYTVYRLIPRKQYYWIDSSKRETP